MTWILFLLCLFGLLGSVDIVYYHLYRCRLYQSASSRREQVTHLLRLAVFPGILFWVLFVLSGGWAAMGLLLLLLFDFANSLLDTYLEPKSREPRGGLPRGEYLLHAVLMGIHVGLLVLVFEEVFKVLDKPFGLSLGIISAPGWARVLGFQLGVGSLVLLVVESWGFLSSLRPKN